jgi:hypothetical protein
MSKLAFSKANYVAIKQRLLANDPDLNDQTLADTLEGLTDITEAIAAIVRSAITDEALADGLHGLMGQMQVRLSRFEERALKHRQIAQGVMVEAGIKKITAPDLTISLRSGSQALIVIDEAAIRSPIGLHAAPGSTARALWPISNATWQFPEPH